MRIYLGSDHAGFELKEQVREVLEGFGHEVVDVGPHSDDPVDYPDYAETVARAVAAGEAVQVWMRPWLSVAGTRCTRCTPLSYFILE